MLKNQCPSSFRTAVVAVTLSCRSPRNRRTPMPRTSSTSPTASFRNAAQAAFPHTVRGTLHDDASDTITSSSDAMRERGTRWSRSSAVCCCAADGFTGSATRWSSPTLITTQMNVVDWPAATGGSPSRTQAPPPTSASRHVVASSWRESAGLQPHIGCSDDSLGAAGASVISGERRWATTEQGHTATRFLACRHECPSRCLRFAFRGLVCNELSTYCNICGLPS